MSLIKCKDCGSEVSTKAKSCPKCGAPIKKEAKQYGCGTVIVVGIGLFILISIFTPDDSSNNLKKPQVSDAECMKTLQCWGDRHTTSASIRCDNYIEKLAKYSFKWTDGILESKFSHFRWKNKSKGIVTFIGDKIQFQNGFGAFQKSIYECDYSPIKDKVLDARARAGSL